MAHFRKRGNSWYYTIQSGIAASRRSREFRLTHISLLAEAGAALHEIMDRVGQVDDETTKKVYLHVTQHRKKEACRLFSSLMKSVKAK